VALNHHLTLGRSGLCASSIDFPADFIRNAAVFRNPGITTNGEAAAANPFLAKAETDGC
jgi:hypothetical protein